MKPFVLGLVGWMLLPLAGAYAGEPAPAREHGGWPFRSPVQSPIPDLPPTVVAGLDGPIDAFIAARLAAAGLELNAPADRLAILRRVTFDLTGLPPTPEEQSEFAADESPDAYFRLIDRLLASPAHGERWAQHWLDVVRYAETEGFKADSLRSQAYKYRDYVIQSLNADRPYDEFVRQQIAGDELQPDVRDAIVATGLNRLYPDENNAANLFQRRQEILDDVTETTGLAFLGLTMGCAQCHDHKFDQILQTDYYRLQAFFAPFVEWDSAPDATAAEVARYREQHAAWEKATTSVRAEIDALFANQRDKSVRGKLTKFRPEIQECVFTPEEKRTPLQRQIARMAMRQAKWRFNEKDALKKLSKDDRARYTELAKRLKSFDHLKPQPLPSLMAVRDVRGKAPKTFRLDGGSWRKPLEEVTPGFPHFLIGGSIGTGEKAAAPPEGTASQNTTGRRSQLARWLTRDDHPLTARVMVNRLWHHHFGRGIVATPNDFGVQGEAPSHPELLDWLAVEFVEHDWSVKDLHRRMVTSAAYRQSSQNDSKTNPVHARAANVDPSNKLLWRARRRRLEGEAIRDALLQISGELSRRQFGKSARPGLPKGLSKRYGWSPDATRESRNRRSVYVFAKRNLRYPLFDAFDLPDLHRSCGARNVTTVPPQALLLLNGDFTLEAAERWAQRLVLKYGRDADAVAQAAYREAFARAPTADELRLAREFLGRGESKRLVATAGSSNAALDDAVLVDFCHALCNLNEFIYID